MKEIQENDNSIKLTFQDGTQGTGDLSIGAEGAHSPTREYLISKDEAQLLLSQVVASFYLTILDKETTLALRQVHPRYCVMFDLNRTFDIFNIR